MFGAIRELIDKEYTTILNDEAFVLVKELPAEGEEWSSNGLNQCKYIDCVL